MSTGLTKRTRTLLISCVALLGVVGLLVAVILLLPPAPIEQPEPIVDLSVPLWKDDATVRVTKATITKGESSYTLTEGDGQLYTVDGYEGLPLDHLYIQEIVDYFTDTTALQLVVESTDSPTDFGFDTDTTAHVQVTLSNATSRAFELGNADPSGQGYYLRMADKPAIYLVDASFGEAILADKKQLLSFAPITAPESTKDDEVSAVRDVTLTGTVRPRPVRFEASAPVQSDEDTLIITGYVIREPYFHTVDKDTPLLRAATFSEMTAEDVVMIHPTNADLKKYGLDTPYSECTVNLALKEYTTEKDENGKEIEDIRYHTVFNYTIKLGNTDENGNYYGIVYTEGTLIPIVYLFSPAQAVWATYQFEDVADDMLFYQYIYNVNTMAITANGTRTEFVLTHDSKQTDDNKKLVVKAGGKTYDTATFRSIYSAMMGIYRVEQSDADPTGDPLLVIEYTQKAEYGGPVRISIYPITAGQYLAVHSSGERHLVSAQVVLQFLNTYNSFLNS